MDKRLWGLSPVFVFFPILPLSFGLGDDRLGLRRDRTSELSWGRSLNADWPAGWENFTP